MNFSRFQISAGLVLIFCLFMSRELVRSWFSTSYEHFSWVLILVWSFPLLYLWSTRGSRTFPVTAFNNTALWLALGSSLVGILGDLNTFQYIALAFALASFVPWTYFTIPWILCSLSWMPALGYIGVYNFPKIAFLVRFLMAGVSAAGMVIAIRQKNKIVL